MEMAEKTTPVLATMMTSLVVSFMGRSFHSTFSNSPWIAAEMRPVIISVIMMQGTTCTGSKPATSMRGVRAVP